MPPSNSKLDRIEEKVNLLAEHMAAARTDISWLKDEWKRQQARASSAMSGRTKIAVALIEAGRYVLTAIIAVIFGRVGSQ
ncbi:MAG: hypothetical protein AB1760_00360 [Pseudomonadota bacterium]